MRCRAWLWGSLFIALGCPGDDVSGAGSSGEASSSTGDATTSGVTTEQGSSTTTQGGEITTEQTEGSTGSGSGSSSGEPTGSTSEGSSSSSGAESSESSGGTAFDCEALPQEMIDPAALYMAPPFREVSNGTVVGNGIPLEVSSRNLGIDEHGRLTGWLEDGSYCSIDDNGLPFEEYISADAAAPDETGERLVGGAVLFHPTAGLVISGIGPLGLAPLYRLDEQGQRLHLGEPYLATLPGQFAIDSDDRLWSPTDSNYIFKPGTTPSFSITAVRYHDDGTWQAHLPVATPLRGFTSGLAFDRARNNVYIAGQVAQSPAFAIVRQMVDDEGTITGEPLVIRQSDELAFHDIRFDQCGNIYFVEGIQLMRAPLAKDGSLAEEPTALVEFDTLPAGGSIWGDGEAFDANSLFFVRADGQVLEVPLGAPGQD